MIPSAQTIAELTAQLNLYDDRLDPERLTILQRRAAAVRIAFQAAHTCYLGRLAELASSPRTGV